MSPREDVHRQVARLYGKAYADEHLGPSTSDWPQPGEWDWTHFHRPGARGAATAAMRAGDESARSALAVFESMYQAAAAAEAQDV